MCDLGITRNCSKIIFDAVTPIQHTQITINAKFNKQFSCLIYMKLIKFGKARFINVMSISRSTLCVFGVFTDIGHAIRGWSRISGTGVLMCKSVRGSLC